ncbi:hypothetical protein PPO43_03240 [Saprospira sp. CCB-QB6]|uniref:hypothetical protein n=1 Tax=Saprospira sp. CCB-QB6 TaxID=3023936 RepID=UPI002348FA8D|nr:hypothetical protein [Saprospira sp. CCB-QB6]WCL82116.1 hypothetical protein PPO43_03240 [Saprospira sp. CCB-QB6]
MPLKCLLFSLALLGSSWLSAQPLLGSCEWETLAQDDFTGRAEKRLPSRWFFSYTPTEYRRFFPNEDYLSASGFLRESEGKLLMELEIRLLDQEADKSFGFLPPKAKLELTAMDGRSYTLYSPLGAKRQAQGKESVYICRFPLKKKDQKWLRKHEISELSLQWSAGTQSYRIYYLDFFKDQLDCLQQQKK